MISSPRLASLSLLAFFAASCSSTGSPSLQERASSTDSSFVTGAGQSSNAEIAAANLAMSKSTNADVLAFAKEMITDHSAQNAALAPAASQAGLTAPADVNATQAAEAQKLMALTGAAFDAEYVNSEINGHELNLNNNFVPEVKAGNAASVVAFAQKYEPQIQMHLSMIEAIKSKDNF